MNTFQIGIPTINRADLLNEALKVYSQKLPTTKIHIWDNGTNQNIDHYPNVIIHRSAQNIGVAASWNRLCEIIYREATHALILNDDVILNCFESQIAEHIQNPFDFCGGNGFQSFILPKTTTDKIGWFDENFFPAYYEDGDYWRRMWLAKLDLSHQSFLIPIQVEVSGSIKKDASLNAYFEKNKAYYISKWGGNGGNSKETYLTPFNK